MSVCMRFETELFVRWLYMALAVDFVTMRRIERCKAVDAIRAVAGDTAAWHFNITPGIGWSFDPYHLGIGGIAGGHRAKGRVHHLIDGPFQLALAVLKLCPGRGGPKFQPSFAGGSNGRFVQQRQRSLIDLLLIVGQKRRRRDFCGPASDTIARPAVNAIAKYLMLICFPHNPGRASFRSTVTV